MSFPFTLSVAGTVIGYSRLENGDAPMAISHGIFIWAKSYSPDTLKELITSLDQKASVNKDSGIIYFSIPSSLCILTFNEIIIPLHQSVIFEYAAEFNETEITVCLNNRDLYEEIFHEHVSAYESQFKTPEAEQGAAANP